MKLRKDSANKGAGSGCMAPLVRLFDSCCMVAPGITGIIVGLFLSVPMVLCLSWMLNILKPFQLPTLQESQILQSTPHDVATSTPSQANVYSTLDLRKPSFDDRSEYTESNAASKSHKSSYDCAIHLIGFFGGLVAGLWTVLNWWRAQNLGRWLRKTFFPNAESIHPKSKH